MRAWRWPRARIPPRSIPPLDSRRGLPAAFTKVCAYFAAGRYQPGEGLACICTEGTHGGRDPWRLVRRSS